MKKQKTSILVSRKHILQAILFGVYVRKASNIAFHYTMG